MIFIFHSGNPKLSLPLEINIRGVFEKYLDCMLCTSNIYHSDKNLIVEDGTMTRGGKNAI